MIVEAPKTLKWSHVVEMLTAVFDFKFSREDPYISQFSALPGSRVHLRRGRVHAVVSIRTDGVVCVDLHEDVGSLPHHEVLTRSRRLNALVRELRGRLKSLRTYGRGGATKLSLIKGGST